LIPAQDNPKSAKPITINIIPNIRIRLIYQKKKLK